VSASPQATFQAMLRASCWQASRSGRPLQRLQHHHGGDDVGGDRGPTSARGEQVGEQLVGEQRPAVVGEEGVHGAVGDQVAAARLGVEKLDAGGVGHPLHARKSLQPNPPTRIAQQAPSVLSC
jgi:hypothetical protein